jgi:hypothetical protein
MKHPFLVTLMVAVLVFCGRAMQSFCEATAPANDDSIKERAVFGIFRGRTPCKEIGKELGWPEREECRKKKLVLTLHHDPATQQPTAFHFRGLGENFKEGKWTIVKGTGRNPDAVVYELTFKETGKSILLLRGDDNVLFFLKSDRTFLIGNENYSYTLNRQEHPAKWPEYVAP